MDLALVRTEFRSDGIFSEFRDARGEMLYTCAEHAYHDGIGAFLPKLADGTYTCKRYFSPDHGYELFLIQDVPPFMGAPVTFVEIHIGNFAQKDSKGCLLVGLGIAAIAGGQIVTQSKTAFENFMILQNGVDSFTLQVTST